MKLELEIPEQSSDILLMCVSSLLVSWTLPVSLRSFSISSDFIIDAANNYSSITLRKDELRWFGNHRKRS